MVKGKEVRILWTIDGIGKEIVDSIADDGFFTYGYFKTVETSKTFNIKPFYLSVSDDDRIVAIAPCYIKLNNRFSAWKKRFPFLQRIISTVDFLGFYSNNLIASYSPESYHSKLLLRENHDPKIILNLLSKKIDEICERGRIPFSSFPYVPESERTLIEHLGNFGYNKSPSVDIFNLDVAWSSFDDYVNSLESTVIRRSVRREIKKCKENGIIITEEKEFEDLSSILSRFHSNLKKKHEGSGENARNASFFKKLSEFAKEKTRVLVAKRGSKIVGFSLSLQHNDVLDAHMCGFDYTAQTRTDFTYFNLSYYMPIRMAIEEGIKKIHYSINGGRVKLKRGCKKEKTYSFIKCHRKFIRHLFNFYRKNVIAR